MGQLKSFTFIHRILVTAFLLLCVAPAQAGNLAPVCSRAVAVPDSIWPPNHNLSPVAIDGISDPDGDPVNVAVRCIMQDEPLNTNGDGNTEFDGDGLGSPTALIRGERAGPQNGRVYHIDFVATDSHGAACSGSVQVGVRHNKKDPAVDDGRLYSSTLTPGQCDNLPINNNPVIASTPITTAQQSMPYAYQVEAFDPDNDVLSYSLVDAPGGMSIVASLGLITWVPAAEHLGEQSVTVRVSDGHGGEAVQHYVITVEPPPNLPPTIYSVPVTEARESLPYQYDVDAIDPDNDPLTYSLVTAPANMHIDATSGVIDWLPAFNDIGEHDVVVRAADPLDADDHQDYGLRIKVRPNLPPAITSTPVTTTAEGTPYAYDVQAEDPNSNDVLTYSLQAAPAGMSIDAASGEIHWQPGQEYVESLQTLNTQCRAPVREDSFDLEPVVKWHWNGDSGGELPTFDGVQTAPVVVQLNDDNEDGVIDENDTPDIVVVGQEINQGPGYLRALDGKTGNVLWTFTDKQMQRTANLAAADIDLDGYIEIVGISWENRLMAISHDGRLKWETADPIITEDKAVGGPAIADIDQDGVPEIIYANSAFTNKGELLWKGSGPFLGENDRFPVFTAVSVVADIYPTDGLEVLAGASLYDNQGNLLWLNSTVGDGYTAIGNFNADSFPEIVVVSKGSVYLLDHEGQILAGPVAIPGGGEGGPPVIADVDGDGEVEIGVAGSTAYSVFDTDLTLLWSRAVSDISSSITGSTAFDFNDDGKAEIVYADEWFLRIYNGADGRVLYETKNTSGTANEYPVVADVDNDNQAEIVVVANTFGGGDISGVRVFEQASGSWVGTRSIWNQYNYHINNINDDGTVPQFEAPSWLTHNTYRLNTFPDRRPRDQADLSVSALKAIDSGNGSVDLQVTVKNRGLAPVPAGVKVDFFTISTVPGGGLLGTVQLAEPLDSDEQVTATLSNVSVDRIGPDIFAAVDSEEAVDECQEDNNFVRAAWVRVHVEDPARLSDEQGFSVGVTPVNRPPVITSEPSDGEVNQGQLFQRQVTAEDSNLGDALRYELVNAPVGMTIDPVTGLVSWQTGGGSQTGEIPVTVRVTDLAGESVEQTFFVTVNPNRAASFVSEPVTRAVTQRTYQYQALAVDPNGDAVVYSLESGPVGMTIDSDGLVNWNAGDVGTYHVAIRADDGKGASALQEYDLSVENNSPPRIVSEPPPAVDEKTVYRYDVEAVDEDPGEVLTYGAAGFSDNVQIDSQSGELSWAGSDHFPVYSLEQDTGCALPPSGNQPLLDVSDWEVLRDKGVHEDIQNWSVLDGGTTALATGNGDPSVFLSNIDLADGVMEINIRIEGGDNDQVGFVWGYQDMQHYYRLLWDQGNNLGLLLTVLDSPEPLHGAYHPSNLDVFIDRTFTWQRFVDYRFILDVRPGESIIYAMQGNRVLRTVRLQNGRYPNGRFGFYVSSQDNVFYSARLLPRSPSPDMVVESIELLSEGDNDEYAVSVLNRGAAAADRQTTLSLQGAGYSAAEGPVDSRVLASAAIPELAAGEKWTTQFSVPAVESYEQLEAVIVRNGMLECNQENNTRRAPVIDVNVTDAGNLSDTQRVLIDTRNVNEPPIIRSQPPLYAIPGEAYRYGIRAVDRDAGDRLSYELVEGPDNMSFYLGGSLLLWTPGEDDLHQNFPVTVRVTDLEGLSSEQSFTITVQQKPRITSTPPIVAREDQAYPYQVIATDPEGDPLEYRLVVKPGGMMINAQTGFISWTPYGSFHDVVVEVTDNKGGVDRQAFTLAVLPAGYVNTPPTITSTPPVTATPLNEYRYQVTAQDPNNDSLRYRLLEGPAAMWVDEDSGLLRWRPAVTQIGEYPVVLEVNDRHGGVVQQSFTVSTADAGNAPPAIISVPQQRTPAGVTYDYRVLAIDYEGEALSFALIESPDGMAIDSAGRISWQPLAADVGLHAVSIRVYDSSGNATMQSFELEVYLDTGGSGNRAPEISSTPVAITVTGGTYQYQVQAGDADGDPLSFVLSTAPAGMRIDSATGLIDWTPAIDQVGSHAVGIEVSDGRGGIATQNYTLLVSAPANIPPQIVSLPPGEAVAGFAYRYAVEATDANGDALSYALSESPAGMTINSAMGAIDWTPAVDQAGRHGVTVEVSDGAAVVSQHYEINVAPEAAPLDVRVSADPAVIDQGENTVITVEAVGGVPPVHTTLTVNGQPVALDTSGRAVVQGQAVGKVLLTATAGDAETTVTTNSFFTVRDPADTAAPVVTITSPEPEGAPITAPVDILGDIVEANLAEYVIAIAPRGSTDFTVLARRNTPVAPGVLGRFDPSLLMNGQYTLAVQATDFNGQTGSAALTVTVDGDLKVGNFSFTVEDLNIPVSGIPIRITRTYDSRRKGEALDFGHGWSIGYQDLRLDESRSPGEDWTIREIKSGPFGVYSTFCTEPVGQPTVTIALPTGRNQTFNIRAKDGCALFSAQVDVQLEFVPADNTLSTLTVTQPELVRLINGSLRVVDTGKVYDPQLYTLTTREGFVYRLDQDFGIRTVTDPNGNTLTYTNDGIFHSDGKSVLFHRDADGRINEIVDPLGHTLEYRYDAAGNLVTALNPLKNATDYRYNRRHGLLDIIDPLGRPIVKNIYDDDGRLIAQEDGNGHRTEFNHDLDGKVSLVTDRLGRVTQLAYDDFGQVTERIDANGKLTSFTYDTAGNQLTQTDPLLRTTAATYDDERNQLTQTDAFGNTTAFEYNAAGQEVRVSDARGNAFLNSYDPFGNLLTVLDPLGNQAANSIDAKGRVSLTQDALGNKTTFTYDDEGNKLSEKDAEGNTTNYTYDANGNVLTETRTRTVNGAPVSETATFEYDARNRRVKTIDALGNVNETVYDAVGNEAQHIDAKGRITAMEHDAYGRLTKTVYPDGIFETKTYDAEGNLLTETDRLQRTTTYEYDKLNRRIKTTFPDGVSTQTEYDAAGQVIAEIDERGNRTEYEYDLAGRRVLARDALGHETHFEYDADGNLIQQTDANGHVTQYEYNVLDQKVKTVFHDGTFTQENYDALGRVTEKTDQAGVSIKYEYDKLGRLTKVIDANGGETRYTYDEAGNKLTQTDANLHTTRWEYDSQGRVTARTLPGGQRETMAYDEVGNLISKTDFNGQTTTYEYDLNDRLVGTLYADGSTETIEYDAVGNRTKAVQTDPQGNGRTTTYIYDNRDRLIREVQPGGDILEYEYDAAGNKTSLSKSVQTSGGPIMTMETYTYDALNRLETVTDNAGNVTSYTYDAVGNRKSMRYPNGNVTDYTYDSLNRLTELTVSNGATTIFEQYRYTLHPTGRRTRIEELSGRVTSYQYDNLYRLTQETVTDPVNGNYSAGYQYDAVGNRMQSIIDGVATSYSYDSNDRLLSAGGTTYTYDNNGNTLTKTENGQATTYGYDPRDRLVSVTGGQNSATYEYNVDGIRTGKTENGASIRFIVDQNRDYAQVVTEITNGAVGVQYLYGDDLIHQDRAGNLSYYLYDGLGSTRALSDGAGSLTDSYYYDVFGNGLVRTGSTENSYLFAGEQFDSALSEYYLRARYYNQRVGRFTQMDTWMGRGGEPLSLNKYIYTENDSVNNVDPTGNFTLGSFGVSTNIQGVLGTIAIQAPRIGFSFLTNAAGNIVGVAATTCVAAYAATSFGMSMPIAEFSKVCDGSVHRGRWQAQGGGLEESESWNQSTPLTLNEGLALLEKLEAKLRPRDRKARAPYFEQAELFARRISLAGGISAADFRKSKSFPTGVPSSHPRVDLEVLKGRAFVPD